MQKSDCQSDDDDSSQQQQESGRRKRGPVVDSLSKIKIKSKKHIYINISMTKYQVIEDVAYELGWCVQKSSEKGNWDVLWTDHMIDTDILMRMHLFQKISHFPGIHVLARKNHLGFSLMEMRKRFPQQYSFFPQTWLLPSNYSQLRTDFQQNKDTNKTYIVKPEADCQGRGIFLTRKIQDVENGKHYVVQEYISKPYLVEGLKFDFRVYVLLCGTNPMRIYVYEQGLARFATEKYVQPNEHNIKRTYVHLTNYAINKKNPKYVYNSSDKNMGVGHKRSLTSVFKAIQRKGDNIEALKAKIDDIIIKTFVVGMPLVSHQYKYCQPEDQSRNMCFHILGIDIMIDYQCNPIIIEVNHTPSFSTDTPLDYKIKSQLIKDTLVLMNINSRTKLQLLKKAQQQKQEKFLVSSNKRQLYENQQMRSKVRQAQLKRDQYQLQNLGQYRRVYPLFPEQQNKQKTDNYQSMIQFAQKAFFSQNNVLRAQIQLEKNAQMKFQKKVQSPVKLPSPTRLSKKHHSLSERIQLERQKRTSGDSVFNSPRKKPGLMTGIKSFGSCKMDSIKDQIRKQPYKGRIQEESPVKYMRANQIQKLPRLESSSTTVNSSVLELKRKQFLGLKQKKVLQIDKSEDLRQLLIRKNDDKSPGTFLVPKTVELNVDVANYRMLRDKNKEARQTINLG